MSVVLSLVMTLTSRINVFAFFVVLQPQTAITDVVT